MGVQEENTVQNIIYSNSGYKIRVKMENTDYHTEGGYRQEILWDFGDGETLLSVEAEHYYKKPGKYTISATLYDINRQGFKNNYTLNVVVKELLPTMMRFTSIKEEVKCSKIEKIANLECLVSNVTDYPLNVIVKRIFKDADDTEKTKSYFDVKETTNFHIDKYWSILKNEQVLYNNSDEVYSSDIIPSETFAPSYTAIYYRLVKTTGSSLALKFYQVLPYKTIDEKLKTIKVLSPNSTINEDVYKTYKVENVYDISNLPQDAVFCGLRGFVDVFYRSDFVDTDNTFSFFYDTEIGDITRQLYSAGNYLNIPPLGLNVKTIHNDVNASNLKVAVSGNFFLNDEFSDIKISDTSTSIFIDPYFEGSLYNGLDINCYIFPVYHYTDEDDIKLTNNAYYIPKDVTLTVDNILSMTEGNVKYGVPSEISGSSDITFSQRTWIEKFDCILNNYIDYKITCSVENEKGILEGKEIRITQKPLRSLKKLVIPEEKVTEVNIDALLDVYMKHPMFLNTPNTREFLKIYLSSFVDKVQTESDNFIDNVANVKTCYLSHLISQLKMMGEEVVEYENSHLEGINDLKKFSRFLSMNHSDLIGHKTYKDWDIEINKDFKGKNIGRRLNITDELTISLQDFYDGGGIGKYEKFAKVTHVNGEEIEGIGCDLVLHDKFNNKTRIINFRDCLTKIPRPLVFGDEVVVKIEDYSDEWDWNLLLPDGFVTMGEKIVSNYNKIYEAENKLAGIGLTEPLYDWEITELKKKIEFWYNEIPVLQERRGNLIGGYYDFYLLNPEREQIRQGNFIADKHITPEIESVKEWNKQWGITHDILMKILLTNANLLTREDVKPDVDYPFDQIWESTVIDVTQIFNSMGNLSENTDKEGFKDANEYLEFLNENSVSNNTVDVIVGDKFKNTSYKVSGTLSIKGKVFSEGDNTLEIKLNNCFVDKKDQFIINEKTIDIVVNGRDIYSTDGSDKVVNVFDVTLDHGEDDENTKTKSKLIVTLWGTIDDPQVQINLVLFYDPIIVIGSVTKDFQINGKTSEVSGGIQEKDNIQIIEAKSQIVTNDGEIDYEFDEDHRGLPFVLSAKANGYVDGVGKKRVQLLLQSLKFNNAQNTNEHKLQFRDFQKIFLEILVQDDGKITGVDDAIATTGKIYLKGSFKDAASGVMVDGENYYPYSGTYNLSDDVWIKLSLGGSVGEPVWLLECGSGDKKNVINFEYEYTALRNEYSNILGAENETTSPNPIIIYTNDTLHGNCEKKDGYYEAAARFENLKIDIISENGYKLVLSGNYVVDNCYFDANDEVQYGIKQPLDCKIDVAIDKFGNIYQYSGSKIQYKYELSAWDNKNLIEQIIENDFNLIFTISGNVIQNAVNCSCSYNVQPTGVLVKLFKEINVNDKSLLSNITVVDGKHEYTASAVEFRFIDSVDDEKLYYKVCNKVGTYNFLPNDAPRLRIDFKKFKNDDGIILEDTEDESCWYITNPISSHNITVNRNGTVTQQILKKDFISANLYNDDNTYKYFDVNDDSDNKLTINADFDLVSIKLGLVTKTQVDYIGSYMSDSNSAIKSSIKETQNKSKYQAICDVEIKGKGFEPDANGEVIDLAFKITPMVSYDYKMNDNQSYQGLKYIYQLSSGTLTEEYQVFVKRIDNDYKLYMLDADGKPTENEFSVRIPFFYNDADENDEDTDGNVNFEVYVNLTPILSNIGGGLFYVYLEGAVIEDDAVTLTVIDRTIKGEYIDNWSIDDSENVKGNFRLTLNGLVSDDNKQTMLRVNLDKAATSLIIHDIDVPLEIINLSVLENENGSNEIFLDENVSGKGTVRLHAGHRQDGQIVEITKDIKVNVSQGEITYTSEKEVISYKNNRFELNRYRMSWTELNEILSGGIVINGKGIKEESFEGNFNIINPEIYGVMLSPTFLMINDEEIDTSSLSLQTQEGWNFYSHKISIINEDEISKPIPVELTLQNGENFIFTINFEFYRDINDENNDGDNTKADIYDLKTNLISYVVDYPTFEDKEEQSYEIIDVTNYEDLGIVQSPNTYEVTKYDISAKLITNKDDGKKIHGFKDKNGEVETITDFSTLSINGVEMTIDENPVTFSPSVSHTGLVQNATSEFIFSNEEAKFNVTGNIVISGDVTDGTLSYDVQDVKLDIGVYECSSTLTLENPTNEQNNTHNFTGSSNVSVAVNGAFTKTSKGTFIVNALSDTPSINGFLLDVNDDDFSSSEIEISVDAEGNITPILRNFAISDKVGIVRVNGIVGISGNIVKGIQLTSESFIIDADELIIKAKQTETKETINGGFVVEALKKDGESYPRNGRIGQNPAISINYTDFIVNGITMKPCDNDYNNLIDWNISGENNLWLAASDDETFYNVTVNGTSIEQNFISVDSNGNKIDGIRMSASLSIGGTISKDENNIVANTIIPTDKLVNTPLTYGSGTIEVSPFTLTDVNVLLGDKITFNISPQTYTYTNTSYNVEIVATLQDYVNEIKLNGWDIIEEQQDLTYSWKINGKDIVKFTGNLLLKGEEGKLTVTNGVLGSITGTATKISKSYERDITVSQYDFTTNGITGKLNFTKAGSLLTKLSFTPTTNNISVEGVEITSGNLPVLTLNVDYDDGDVTSEKVDFTLQDDETNPTVIITGKISISGNVANTSLKATVTDINVEFISQNYVAYDDDGNVTSAKLNEIERGDYMFKNNKLDVFSATMPLIRSGESMFEGCTQLTTFSSNMPNLINGKNMFKGCTNLTTFNGMMPKLSEATGMFTDCRLNETSVRNIITQLQLGERNAGSGYSKYIILGVDKSLKNNSDFVDYLTINKEITQKRGGIWIIKIKWN